MTDKTGSLPPYPAGADPKLPPSRRDWGTALWVIFVALLTGGALAIFFWLILPGLWVIPTEILSLMLVGLGLCGFAIFVVLLYVWQRSERQDR